MFYYTNYDKATGKIKSSGMCSNESDVELNKRAGFEQLKGICGNGAFQKVENRIDEMIPYRILVDKTPEEIEASKPPEKPEAEQQAHITNKQWRDVLDIIKNMESKA